MICILIEKPWYSIQVLPENSVDAAVNRLPEAIPLIVHTYAFGLLRIQ